MKNKRFIQYIENLFTGFFFVGIFIFFAFFYNNHLHFEEQVQLFLLTDDYFLSKISIPGGFSGYMGGFLTQFYYSSLAGPFIITLLLLGIQLSTKHIFRVINENRSFFPLSFLPALYAAMIICNEFYPLSAVVGFLIALLLFRFYLTIEKTRYRFITGILLIPVAYWLTGGSFLMLISVILIFEIFVAIRFQTKSMKSEISEISIPDKLKVWHLATYIVLAAGIPLLVRHFLILQPLMLTFVSEFYYDIFTFVPIPVLIFFSIPAALLILLCFLPVKEKIYRAAIYAQITGIIVSAFFGFRFWTDFRAEKIMKYDHLVRNERWADVITIAEKTPPENDLSLAMLNLSLAKTGKMGDRMFNFEQNGIEGLFLPSAKEFIAFMMVSEIYYHLGLINASQEYAFESMEITPKMNNTVRSIKRLAETNLINGQYEVAKKYLKLLKNTIFYHNWARNTEKYLYNEDMINKHPVWGAMRKSRIKHDFFSPVRNMESILKLLLEENTQNRIAFEYLMAFYLLNKDLRNFISFLPLLNELNYKNTPISYQEAIMYVIVLTRKDPISNISINITDDTKARMKAYADIYTTYKNPQELLRKRFSGTYWYYIHYKSIDMKNKK